jgi:anti-sigma factor RsiW
MSHLGRRLSALIDGELSDTERDQAHAHLVTCEACRAEAAALRTLKRRIHELGEAPADGTLTSRLMALECLGASALAPASSIAASAFARGHLHTRYLVVGAVAALAVGLGAASFAAGGDQHVPGPTVTPEVDSYNLQHAATFGELPTFASPSPAPTQSQARQTAGPLQP